MKRFPIAARAIFAFAFILAGALLQAQGPLPVQANPPLTIRILYDNRLATTGTKARHGFSCLVSDAGTSVLFDSGADGKTLAGNMRTLGVDPDTIDAVVISHLHNDHTGGLSAVFRADAPVPVFIPQKWLFASGALKAASVVTEGFCPLQALAGAYLSGPLGRSNIEQALIIDAPAGIVLITGCAHPGVVEMVEAVETALGRDVYAVLGGFHLAGKSEAQVKAIIARLKVLGVKKCGAGHCTGDSAIALFREAFGDGFLELGTGAELVFDTVER